MAAFDQGVGYWAGEPKEAIGVDVVMLEPVCTGSSSNI